MHTYKTAGTVNYRFGDISPLDPTGYGLGVTTRERAQAFVCTMNELLVDFETDPIWGDFWTSKPDPWIVFENF